MVGLFLGPISIEFMSLCFMVVIDSLVAGEEFLIEPLARIELTYAVYDTAVLPLN